MAPAATLTDLAPRLRLAITRLARRLRQQGGDGVTPSQTSALATVERLGAATLGELAQAERVRPPSMTRIVGALLDAGLVARETDEGDRRVARVRLTPEGRRLVERTRTRRTAYLAARLRTLSEDERELIERALPVLERLIEDER